jgi:hypothetical protein
MGLEDKYYDWQQEYEQTSYSKKEVDDMLDELYEGLMIEIEEKYGRKKGTKYYFRIKLKNLTNKNVIIAQLHKELIQAECIDDIPYKAFNELFTGGTAKEPYTQIKWLKTQVLLIYLIDELAYTYKWLDSHELDDKIQLYCLNRKGESIKGVSSQRSNLGYNERQDYKPTNNEIIDKVLGKIDSILKS